MMDNFEFLNENNNLYPMEEKYDFTTSYFVNSPSLYQESIDKITTSLKITKSVGKDTEIGRVIGHGNMSNNDDSMRVSVQ